MKSDKIKLCCDSNQVLKLFCVTKDRKMFHIPDLIIHSFAYVTEEYVKNLIKLI